MIRIPPSNDMRMKSLLECANIKEEYNSMKIERLLNDLKICKNHRDAQRDAIKNRDKIIDKLREMNDYQKTIIYDLMRKIHEME